MQRFLVLWVLLLLTSPLLAGTGKYVPVVRDLYRIGMDAQQQQIPVLIMFSAEHCGYCVKAENEFLKPMVISGEYVDKVIMVQIRADSSLPIVDFDGKEVSVKQLTQRYKAFVTPTLVFVNGYGVKTSKNLVGVMTADFYGAYIDESINNSIQQIRAVAFTSDPLSSVAPQQCGVC